MNYNFGYYYNCYKEKKWGTELSCNVSPPPQQRMLDNISTDEKTRCNRNADLQKEVENIMNRTCENDTVAKLQRKYKQKGHIRKAFELYKRYVRKRQLKFIMHMRKEGLEHLTLTRLIGEKRQRVKQCIIYLTNRHQEIQRKDNFFSNGYN